MKKCIKILMILLLLSFCSLASLFSSTVVDIKNISSIIQSNSIDIRTKRMDVKIKEIYIKNQIFEYFPSFDMNYNNSYNNLFHRLNNPRSYKNDPLHTFSISSKWDIFNNAERIIEHRTEKLEYNALKLEYNNLIQEEIKNALSLFLDTISKKMDYIISISNQNFTEMQYEYVKLKKEQGNASQLELINAKANYDSALYNTASKKLEHNKSLSALKRKLQISDIILSEVFIDDNSYFQNIKYETNIQNLINSIYEVKSARNRIKGYNLSKNNALRKRISPYLDIGFKLGIYSAHYIPKDDDKAYYKKGYDYGWIRRSSNIMDGKFDISINYPIFENNTDVNAIRNYKILIEKERLNLKFISENKKSEIIEMTEELKNKIMLLPISEQKLNSSRINYEKMNESYQLGLTSLINLFEAENDYRESQKEFKNLKLEIIELKADIGYLHGNTLIFLFDEGTK